MKEKDASIQGVWYREKGDNKDGARKIPFYKPILVTTISGYHPHHKPDPGYDHYGRGSSGGCDAGVSGLALALVGVFLLRKKA